MAFDPDDEPGDDRDPLDFNTDDFDEVEYQDSVLDRSNHLVDELGRTLDQYLRETEEFHRSSRS